MKENDVIMDENILREGIKSGRSVFYRKIGYHL